MSALLGSSVTVSSDPSVVLPFSRPTADSLRRRMSIEEDPASAVVVDSADEEQISLHIDAAQVYFPDSELNKLGIAVYGPHLMSASQVQMNPIRDSLSNLISLGKLSSAQTAVEVIGRFMGFTEDYAAAGLEDFYGAARSVPGWSDSESAGTANEMLNAWYIIYSVLGFRLTLAPPNGPVLLKDHFQEIFPECTESIETFSHTGSLLDIAKAGLNIIRTDDMTEHLRVDGNAIKVLRLDGSIARFLHHYRGNKLARALQISSLGAEIFGSFSALIGGDPEIFEAVEKLGILKIHSSLDREFIAFCIQREYKDTTPKVLATRVLDLQSLLQLRQRPPRPPADGPSGNASTDPFPGQPAGNEPTGSRIPSPPPESPPSPSNLSAGDVLELLANRHNNERTGFRELILPSENDIEALSQRLYSGNTPPGNEHILRIAMKLKTMERETHIPLTHILALTRCLIDYLEGNTSAVKTFQGLVDHSRGELGVPTNPDAELNLCWSVLCASLDFPAEIPQGNVGSLKLQFRELFPMTSQRVTFSLTISDILGADLKIVPTSDILEHFKVSGNEVKLLTMGGVTNMLLVTYDQNKVAGQLGLSSLGREIIASYAVMTEGRELMQLATNLGLFHFSDDFDRDVVTPMLFSGRLKSAPPNLLASRVLELNNLIRSRRSAWNSLTRNVSQQQQQQPWAFLLAVAAIVALFCTIIQTVVSLLAWVDPQ